MRIKFSVIIPTFNREKLLIKALNSVLSQNYQNFEIIIVDNFSTDQTEKNIKLYTQNINLLNSINMQIIILLHLQGIMVQAKQQENIYVF